jgi:hypothetical protein
MDFTCLQLPWLTGSGRPRYRDDDDEWGWVLMIGVDESSTATHPLSL